MLLSWYRAHRRALPWREGSTPYHVLVSEIMLQQTRVEVVIPYYQRFLDAFPGVEALAAAPLDAVLARWSGLGYYSRARRLHQAARDIVERGDFPRTERELLELPGVGAYTAAAIASIAFAEAVPVVDGNVERVLARLLDLDADPKRGASRERVRAAAALLLDAAAPGDSNQAMMELGATVCRPRQPSCLHCPLDQHCLARARGTVEDRPVRAATRAAVRERRVVVVARRGERFLLTRNPDTSELLAGLWEFPWIVGSDERAAWEDGLARAYGGVWRVGARLGRARHGITFRSIELEVHEGEVRLGEAGHGEAGHGDADLDRDAVAEGPARAAPSLDGTRTRAAKPAARWLSLDQIAEVPTTSMVRKVLACVEGAGTGPAPTTGQATVDQRRR